MRLMALLALPVAFLGGCAGLDPGGYYTGPGGYNATQAARGAVLCHFPPKDAWHEFYTTTNTAAACREVGGVPIGK